MRRITILIIYIILSIGNSTAQVERSGAHFFCRNVGLKAPIDRCELLVTYRQNFIVDTSENISFYDTAVLEIGEHHTNFYSILKDGIDSIGYDPPKHDDPFADGINPFNYIAEDEFALPYIVLNYTDRKVREVFTHFYRTDYIYTEDIEPMNWVMTQEVDSILGYRCNVAQAAYRGMIWKVWYTVDIPFSYGPWKFGGLPGLILRVEDFNGQYGWNAIGIERPKDRPIYRFGTTYVGDPAFKERSKFMSKDQVKVTRKRLRGLEEIFYYNPDIFIYMTNSDVKIYDPSTGNTSTVSRGAYSVPKDFFYPRWERD